MSKKREKKRQEEDVEESLPDLRNRFFDRIVRAALEGETSIENLLKLCNKYGKQHGEAMRKKIENNTSYSKVYSNSRRQSRGQPIGDNAIVDANSTYLEVQNNIRPLKLSHNAYSHPFYKMYHSGKHASFSSSAKNSLALSNDVGSASKRTRYSPTSLSTKSIPINNDGSVISDNGKMDVDDSESEPIIGSSTVPKPAVKLVEGLRGVEGIADKTDSSMLNFMANRYIAFLTIMGRRIDLGEFPRDREAALAHDRALIRALGPVHCPQDQLNFPISSYAHDPLESFMRYDIILKRALTGTSWDGLKDCDFGFLLTQSYKISPKKRKSAVSSSPASILAATNASSTRSSTRSGGAMGEQSNGNSTNASVLNTIHNESSRDVLISANLYNNLKPPITTSSSIVKLVDDDLYFK